MILVLGGISKRARWVPMGTRPSGGVWIDVCTPTHKAIKGNEMTAGPQNRTFLGLRIPPSLLRCFQDMQRDDEI